MSWLARSGVSKLEIRNQKLKIKKKMLKNVKKKRLPV
jgi:hypothetical protein